MEGRSSEDAADGRGEPDRDDFEILRESPTLGEGKYKLEIGTKKTRPFPFVDIKRGRF